MTHAVRTLAPTRGSATVAAGSSGGTASDLLQQSPRLVAQRHTLQAAFGCSKVLQRVPTGRYLTSGQARLRDDTPARAALATVAANTLAQADGSRTQRFSLGTFSFSKDHTWVTCEGRQGWLRDNVLTRAAPPERRAPITSSLSLGLERPDRDVRSAPRAMGGAKAVGRSLGRDPPATVTAEQLNAYRNARDPELEEPGTAKGANPLGLGGPQADDPKDYRITVKDRALHDRSGSTPLTVVRSPFVLSPGGELYGGQGDAGGFVSITMKNHGVPQVGSPAWAGELAADDGRVTYINNQSGTFMLSDKANVNLILFLYRHRVLEANEIGDLDVNRVYKPGEDRDGALEPHKVLKD